LDASLAYSSKNQVPGHTVRETRCLGVRDISPSKQVSLFYLGFQNTQMRAESHYRILLLADCAPYFCPNWRCLHKRTPIDLASRRLLLRCQVLARETQVN
jgi:hypothetical protein